MTEPKPCVKCESLERDARGRCKACKKAASARYYAENKEKVKNQHAAWAQANPERFAQLQADWRERNGEHCRKYIVEYRAKNAERLTAQRKSRSLEQKRKANAITAAWAIRNAARRQGTNAAWRAQNKTRGSVVAASYYAAHRAGILAKQAARMRQHPEIRQLKNHARRASKLGSGGSLSKGIRGKLFSLQRGKCACCGEPLGSGYHMDHIMPLALGGTNTDDNVQLLRQRCNNQKHAKHPVDFMQSRGFLL